MINHKYNIMWIFNSDLNKWTVYDDKLTLSDYEYNKQQLQSTRYYSKCLSGSSYLPINNMDNIYDILGDYQPRNFYIQSQYEHSIIPISTQNLYKVNNESLYDYKRYSTEYNLSLKNLFTPERLIKDLIKNYIYVDVATNESIDLSLYYTELYIDNTKILNGHRILVKDQITTETLPNDIDPKSYFKGNYYIVQDYGATTEYKYFNSENGIYTYNNGLLTKTNDLSQYEDCVRYSVSVKLGFDNNDRQYHLSRLLNGLFPTTNLNEPIEFIEKHNWILRHRVDYNNIFETNYYDIIKESAHMYNLNGITYSIPDRSISVGEFGVIKNTQNGISNIISNKYKSDLKSISLTNKYYWICGDDSTILKVRKHDFYIENIIIEPFIDYKSISFYDDLNGVVVGDFNKIFITKDGGVNWDSIIIDDFDSYNYNSCDYTKQDSIYIGGNSGVYLELVNDINEWSVYKRHISRFIDINEECVLVDNINDIYQTELNIHVKIDSNYYANIDSNYYVISNPIFIVCDDNKIILHDINNSIPDYDFIYLELNKHYGNIKKLSVISNKLYFVSDNGLYNFDISNFTSININTSNIINVNIESTLILNNISNYKSEELYICGDNAITKYSSYPDINFVDMDSSFNDRLKSKLLFLDYDIASKLNFFTDAGDYRLPNDAVFSINTDIVDSVFNDNSIYNINSIEGDNTFSIGLTVSNITNNVRCIEMGINI